MRRVKKRTFSGCVLEQEIYSISERGSVKTALPRLRFKDEAERQAHKDGIARRRHARLINENYSPESLYSTLTFDVDNEVHTSDGNTYETYIENGADGVGIKNLYMDESPHGEYWLFIDYTDGTSYSYSIPKPQDGKTPQKGVDYWTEEDKAEIEDYVDETIATNSKWRLLRDETLTEDIQAYKVTTDSEGKPFEVKKLLIEVYADTTNGVYGSTGNLLFDLCRFNNDQYWAKTGWATTPFPTTEGKFSFIRLDAEVIGTRHCELIVG